MIRFEGVGFAHPEGPRLFEGLDARFPEGRVSAVAGPNGTGKSTLLRLAAGLLTPAEGCARVSGLDMGRAHPLDRAKRAAYVPQKSLLPSDWPVGDAVALGDFPHQERPPAPRPLAVRLAEARAAFALEPLWDRPVASLSGGEAQRVVLARALVQDAPALLLDEPASHLDLRRQVLLHHALERLAAEGRAVLLATHDVNLPRLWGFDLFLLDRRGRLRPFPPSEPEQRRLLEEVYETPLVPTPLGGVTCWFPDVEAGRVPAPPRQIRP